MFKGIIAEAACKVEVIDKLDGWKDTTPPGQHVYDFRVQRGQHSVTIQTKLQRSEGGETLRATKGGLYDPEQFVVETQKTRGGEKNGKATRPYYFGEFDILAVAMKPSTGSWADFRFTVERWLVPRTDDRRLIAVYQPVSLKPNEDWTDDLKTAIRWLKSDVKKTIRGAGAKPRAVSKKKSGISLFGDE